MTIVIYPLIISFSLYIMILIWFIYGNYIKISSQISKGNPPVSIIIAIRNGEQSLPNLMFDLSMQNYSGKMEFILIDDESVDATKELIIKKSNQDKRFIYVSSSIRAKKLRHKKGALDVGIKKASNEWLLFTDVDCRLGIGWVKGMAKYFNTNADYIVGLSEVENYNLLVTKFQSLDFLMMMIADRGATNHGKALACSGQNQAYRKSLFEKVGGFDKISNELQGDDSLFLQLCRKYNDITVEFADNVECRTISRQEKAWAALIKQRIRWAGDVKAMIRFNLFCFLVILITFFSSLLMLLIFLLGVFYDFYYFSIFVKFSVIHFIFELTLYSIGIYKLNKPMKLTDFSIWYLIHIPYIVCMGFGNMFTNRLSWRGRLD